MNLIEAAKSGNIDTVRELLITTLYTNPHEIEEALQTAISNGNLEIVEILIKYTNPNLHNENRFTPLELAILNKQIDIIEYLLKEGVDPNLRDAQGITPLHLAIDTEIESAIYKSELSGKSFSPSSAISKLLVQYGADVNAKTHNGETPLDWALNGHIEAQKLLREHGGLEGNIDNPIAL